MPFRETAISCEMKVVGARASTQNVPGQKSIS